MALLENLDALETSGCHARMLKYLSDSFMEIQDILQAINSDIEYHSCTTPKYQRLKADARELAIRVFGESGPNCIDSPDLGTIQLPYFSMGSIDSTNLFDLDELIIFCMYSKSRHVYRKCLDIGSNLGLHSIIMANLGMKVTAYEPDPIHFDQLSKNIQTNNAHDSVKLVLKAVSSKSGRAEFTRVVGNTTGSHLSGAKKDVYGQLDKFEVDIISITEILDGIDFMKLDAEGEEKNILLAIPIERWDSLDIMAEVGSLENSRQIFDRLSEQGVNIFAQRKFWQRINSADEMPRSYRDGSVFISRKTEMPWFS